MLFHCDLKFFAAILKMSSFSHPLSVYHLQLKNQIFVILQEMQVGVTSLSISFTQKRCAKIKMKI